jgi:toluene monooxygenase system protein E
MSPPPGSTERRRTWSDFGDMRRIPSEYEIVTHNTNWTLRKGRAAALEASPSSPANLWFLTYRDRSPLHVEDWNGFRDPDEVTYRRYVTMQDEQETIAAGLLEEYAKVGHDRTHSPEWRACLAKLFAPTRYSAHAMQMAHAYLAQMAPSSYISNCAAFAAADMLRRVSLTAYRTRELQKTWPEDGFGVAERAIWETEAGWQETRKALEFSLIAYDWAECFCAINLVLRPSIEHVLNREFGGLARRNADEQTWLLLSNLSLDSERCDRWSTALARFAIDKRPANRDVFQRWVAKWAPRADLAVAGLGNLICRLAVDAAPPSEIVSGAKSKRESLLRLAGIQSH